MTANLPTLPAVVALSTLTAGQCFMRLTDSTDIFMVVNNSGLIFVNLISGVVVTITTTELVLSRPSASING